MKSSIIALILILLLGSFLRLYKLDSLMPFIGDQGWFFISARDLIIKGEIPLVGITASYTWLSQGAIWTYMLAPVLFLFDYNPLGGAYLSVVIGILTILTIYYVGKELFKNEEIGLISALLFAVSPLIIMNSRMAYHTSPIALFVLLFILSLYKYSVGNLKYLPIATFFLGILYGLQLSTMVFWLLLFVILIFVRKLKFKIAAISLIAFLIPVIPMIIHDIYQNSGYFQTTAFLRFIKLSLESGGSSSVIVYKNVLTELLNYNQRLVFIYSEFLSFVIIVFGFLTLFKVNYQNYKKKIKDNGIIILTLWILISILGIFINKTVSGAYLPMIFPAIILMIAFTFSEIIKKNREFKYIFYMIIGFIVFVNVITLIKFNYNRTDNAKVVTYKQMLKVSSLIVSESEGKNYNLKVIGEGDEFENFSKNYEYLTWWLGNAPATDLADIKFTIEEKNGNIYFIGK